ncbi:C39 family peptidase [Psychromicrobium lacuslunae]|uniref:Peptidase C39-like domain-containing protein n=1 Tax=Psychromicrobium lacuslunae TaxID=1618207 RepID=A0A0D4BYT7_9MICC|nr:C39 family peptidase [Psychromicrobium lacuslunae]AJT41592.1 hypothetical protein UM93_08830 [Psychromicrobium lacuslunae]
MLTRRHFVKTSTLAVGAAAAGMAVGVAAATPAQAEYVTPALVPIMQSTTGAYAAYNCGPTSVTMALVAKGIKPAAWPDKVAAVQLVRRDAMKKVGSGGTTLAQIQAGFAYYGKGSHIAGIDEAINWAHQGHAVVVGGDAATPAFNWAKWLTAGASGVGHYVFLAGYDSSRGYKILDPVSASSANVVHYVSESAIRAFSSYYPYQSNVIPNL